MSGEPATPAERFAARIIAGVLFEAGAADLAGRPEGARLVGMHLGVLKGLFVEGQPFEVLRGTLDAMGVMARMREDYDALRGL
jgi:hypothetical protein